MPNKKAKHRKAEKRRRNLEIRKYKRMKKGRKTQQKFKKHYNWDKTAKVWEDYFDSA